MMEPQISVGIMLASTIRFSFNGQFKLEQSYSKNISGCHEVHIENGKIRFDNESYDLLTFVPQLDDAEFSIYDVCIGIGFHWERTETQIFKGVLCFVVDNGKIWAINKLSIEDYLFCVIASEMSATSSLELLKAHAVVSRSWLMAQLHKGQRLKNKMYKSTSLTQTMLIKWYDREDHTLFDVCADDHCQRYQGLTRAKNNFVRQAIDVTCGQVIVYDGEICDTRFSKCCGGYTERFESCWEPVEHPYLQSFADSDEAIENNLTSEDNAQKWILSSPQAFCNTNDKAILQQVLNNYDQETSDFFRWEVRYTASQLTAIVLKKTGLDFGQIISLIPIERGPSARIVRLRIIGEKLTFDLGKELEIRRALSETHLYSSAFVVENTEDGFLIRGAGWGHGVGMCQIGAAVMSCRGYDYKQIINHYFRKAEINKMW